MEDETSAVVAEAIAELEEQARGSADLQGETKDMIASTQTLTKKSMVRSNGVELPDRVRFYRSRGGWEAWLPTAQLIYHLSKRHDDGTPVFVKERPTEYDIPPIEETCGVCKRNTGKVKLFYHKIDYVSHMEKKHPREYRMDKEEAQIVSGGDVAAALMNMTVQERQAISTLLGGSTNGNEEKQSSGRVPCPDCGKHVKPRGLIAHKRFCSAVNEGGATD